MKGKVIHTLYAGLGGHAAVVFPFLEADVSKDYDHALVFYGVEKTDPNTLEHAQNIGANTVSITKKPKQYLKPFKEFRSILNEEHPSAIIVHNSELLWPALNWKRLHPDCKVIYVEHQDESKKGFILKRLSKTAAKKADYTVCLNQATAVQLNEKYNYRNPLVVIPNGINTDLYRPKEKTIQKVIGMASRMVTGKDHETLLKAFAILYQADKTFRLEIAGDGPTLKNSISLAKSIGIEAAVKFHGRLPENQMPNFYDGLDFYVQATFAETLSTSILQAMACKVPVIASTIPNNAVLINHETTGLLFTNKDEKELAEQIMRLVEETDLYQNMTTNARQKIVEYYSHNTMAAGYVQLINGKFDS